MKFVCIFLIALSSFLNAEEKFTSWLYEQPFKVTSRGLYEITLPHDTLNVSSRSLKDIRLVSPNGTETPYFLDRTQQPAPGIQAAADFSSSIINDTTVLTARTQTNQPISGITLKTPSSDFIKPAKVEVRQPNGEWMPIANNEVIFRHKGGAERLTIPFSQSGYLEIKVTINDQRAEPIPFTGMDLTIQGVELPTMRHMAMLVDRKEEKNTTRASIFLGVKNIHLSKLHLDINDSVFSRRHELYYWDTSNPKQPRKVTISDGSIYAVNIEGGASTKQTSLSINRIIPSDTVILEINNGDSPPLDIEKNIRADVFPTRLIFHPDEPGEWKLMTGFPEAPTPVYDLVALSSHLSNRTTLLGLGPIRKNPNYSEPDVLPGINPEGADIDLSNWAYRRPIDAPENGLIQLHLDPATLALCRSDLGDVRIIQDGKQLPYLINPTAMAETIRTDIELIENTTKSNLSKWKITHGYDQLPISKVIITPGSPMFERWIEIKSVSEDQYGKPIEITHSQTNWVMKLRENEDSRLHLPLSNNRLPESFYVTTLNGDNPPIIISAVDVVCAKPSVTFKRISSKPVFLYYGNPKAHTPNYDLQLIRHELASVVKQPGLTGNTETMIAGTHDKRPINTGSPWLWIALGLVVITLLIVISKLLPAPAPEGES